MKIGQYRKRRCKHVELEQFGRLSRRAGLSAIAGLSCLVKHARHPACTDFPHQQVFTQDSLNRTSAYAHSVSYQLHIESLTRRFCNTVFSTARQFLPARRRASAGYSDRNVSVRPSVCLSRAGIVSKRRKLAA